MSTPYAFEKQVAISAVLRACSLTSSVFNKLVKGEKLVKGDKSPVTVGDFSAQAVVNTMLKRAFPDDPIVGEEDSADLRVEGAETMKNRVIELANQALTADLVSGDSADWGIGPGSALSADELLDAIDRGNFEGGSTGRMWTLDPIDGTKGFLRGEQYAVCLAFLVDSKVQVGVMGCPNLPVDWSKPEGQKGCLFVGVRGHGAHMYTLDDMTAEPLTLKIPPYSPETLNFLESVEAAHTSHSFNDTVAKILEIKREPTRMDSQAKYCCLARGDGGVYMRMPTGVGYKEKIWDHASGAILVEEAGGVISDSRGEPISFGLGRTLGENFGVIAAGKEAHVKVIEAVKKAKESA